MANILADHWPIFPAGSMLVILIRFLADILAGFKLDISHQIFPAGFMLLFSPDFWLLFWPDHWLRVLARFIKLFSSDLWPIFWPDHWPRVLAGFMLNIIITFLADSSSLPIT